jgi:hypothetical protein
MAPDRAKAPVRTSTDIAAGRRNRVEAATPRFDDNRDDNFDDQGTIRAPVRATA